MAKQPHRGQRRAQDARPQSGSEHGPVDEKLCADANELSVKNTGRTRPGRTRMCAVTRQTCHEQSLIRFVAGPDGALVADLKNRLGGRGVWVTATRDIIEQAVKRGVFARGLKQKVTIPDEFAAQIDAQFHRAALQALGMAKKAGNVVLGTDRIRQAIDTDEVVAVIHAIDSSADGTTKIDQKFRHFLEEPEETSIITSIFTSDEMSLALGHPNVVHAALMEGGASRMVLKNIARLRGYRSGVAPNDVEQSNTGSAGSAAEKTGNLDRETAPHTQ